MKRLFIISILSVICTMFVHAQSMTIVKPSGSSKAPVKAITLDEAYLRCQYQYQWISDTANVNNPHKTDDMILEIGKDISKFYSYKTFMADSLIRISSADEVLANPSKYRGGVNISVFKNYPSDKETVTDKIGTDYYSYEEALPEFDWEICDSTIEIIGYHVQMAECSFRGRDYIAWFTSEIPVSEGPFKFCGLPGLILKISDTSGEHSFTIKGITKCSDTPITIKEYQYLKTDRKKYTRTLRRFKTDPIGFLSATSNVKIAIKNEDGTDNKELAKPKAMTYDFIERDIR